MALKLNERYPGRFGNPSAGYPQGSFKNRTTPDAKDGSYLEKDWANDKEGFFQSLLSDAGIEANGSVDQVGSSQYFSALKQIVGDLIKKSGPVVGTVRNGRMSITAASATATYLADEVVVKVAAAGQGYTLAGLNKTINLATVGAGGMDAGAAPNNGWVAIYAIYNPITEASALLGVNVTSALAPEIYGGANMPAGYTASGLLTVLGTNGAGQFKAGWSVSDRRVAIPQTQLFTTQSTQAAPGTLINIASLVPRNAKRMSGNLTITSTSTSLLSVVMDSNQLQSGRALCSSGVSAGQPAGNNFSNFELLTPQTIYITTSSSAGTPTYAGYVVGYEI
ncbi:hypothetical protein [Pseudomonas plecoglossicida]|uniref:hypothetical protein n=1 Tax=Pseudomonas plecoglossicida TaxID=70775 RepID=UPI003D1C0CD7